MTRAYREKLNGQKQSVGNFTYTTVRIRLPEGLVLQGEFSAGAGCLLIRANQSYLSHFCRGQSVMHHGQVLVIASLAIGIFVSWHIMQYSP